MKAAVLHKLGAIPKYENLAEPLPFEDNQIILNVKAASVKNLDKMIARGVHYTTYAQLPTAVGIDGVGELQDGTKVYAQGITGMIAEKALINRDNMILLPENLDFITAAALPNALMGSALALRFRAKLKKDNTVLINGATGVTGQVAVQIAKYYGASKVIATGRNEQSLKKLKSLGADEIISLRQSDEQIIKQLRNIHEQQHIDIVLDYLWGHPVELILRALQKKQNKKHTSKVRLITIGESAGSVLSLASGDLRSTDIEIAGSGIGSLPSEEMQIFHQEILPSLLQLAAEGRLKIETEIEVLKNIEHAWQKEVGAGKRLVIKI